MVKEAAYSQRWWVFLTILLPLASWGKDLTTSAVRFENAPSWLTEARIDKVTSRIQRALEWDIRRIQARYYPEASSFNRVNPYDSSVLAFTRSKDQSIHIGPKVGPSDFDVIFGHELAHVILRQKYKSAIPNWLEEGLANYVAKRGSPDYLWLKSQPKHDVRSMNHPYKDNNVRYHYAASTALMEMLANRCDIHDLLQLSVGSKLENYLGTLCGIKDLNLEFQQWVEQRALRSLPKKR